MKKARSRTLIMEVTLEVAAKFGGKLIRRPGGFWTHEGCKIESGTGLPMWHVGTPTIFALVSRGKLEYSAWQPGRKGSFPIEAILATGKAKL